jgi:hypothetical protein
MKKIHCPICKINPEDNCNYFFGYYDKCPWNKDETKVLAHRINFLHHFPNPEDEVELGAIDLKTNKFIPFAKSLAWNWQQGTQLQWIMWQNKECAIYNIKRNHEVIAQIYDFETEDTFDLPTSIYSVNSQGTYASTINYARLFDCRKDYGIAGLKDPWFNDNAPHADGVYIIDLKTGMKKLIVSTAFLESTSTVDIRQYKQRENHIMFNPSGSRICFLHRYFRNDGIQHSRLFTSDIEGKDIRLLFEGLVSHYDWKDDETILAWAGKRKVLGSGDAGKLNPATIVKRCLKPVYYALGKPRILMQKFMGDSYYLIKDQSNGENNERIGMGIMYCDGHCTYSKDKRWILTDGYTNSNNQLPLFLYDTLNGELYEIGRYSTPKELDNELRIDLHPRFNTDGTKVLIDSGMDGRRGMYVVDVSQITKNSHGL